MNHTSAPVPGMTSALNAVVSSAAGAASSAPLDKAESDASMLVVEDKFKQKLLAAHVDPVLAEEEVKVSSYQALTAAEVNDAADAQQQVAKATFLAGGFLIEAGFC